MGFALRAIVVVVASSRVEDWHGQKDRTYTRHSGVVKMNYYTNNVFGSCTTEIFNEQINLGPEDKEKRASV